MQIYLRPVDAFRGREDDNREIRELAARVWGPPEQRAKRFPSLRLTWAGPSGWIVRVRDEGQLVSSVGIVQRTVLRRERCVDIGGISGMMTDPAHQRRGFGRAAMERAADFILQELRAEMGLLLSSESAVPFFLRLGWRVIEGPVLCEQPEGTLDFTEAFPHEPAMVLVPAGHAVPTGTINLRGLPW